GSSVIAVIWQLGLLALLGYGIDPMGILVPFLVFAIAVSHGIQMVSRFGAERLAGAESLDAARSSFRQMLVPGAVALASDGVGFLTLWLIPVPIIREMAVTASLGVAAAIFTNQVLTPVLLSAVPVSEAAVSKRAPHPVEALWRGLAHLGERGPAAPVLLLAALAAVFAAGLAQAVKIGDQERGVPELAADSRYNRDVEAIDARFSIGVDVLTVFAETSTEGCLDYDTMTAIDDFAWTMSRTGACNRCSRCR
ncbi:MAG: RND family transporter, partial [Dehalococcoidia bacterium]